MDPQFYLSPAEERARYELHQNSSQDAGFLKFLEPFVDFVQSSVPAGGKLLDFGSGPEKVLSGLLVQRGFQVVGYDPYFENEAQNLMHSFDGIFLHEVIEHLKDPLAELSLLQMKLKPKASILIRTSLHQGEDHFKTWYYPKDSTHIGFFSRKTEKFLQKKFALRFF